MDESLDEPADTLASFGEQKLLVNRAGSMQFVYTRIAPKGGSNQATLHLLDISP